MNAKHKTIFRCHDADACAMGQAACPTPSICGCAATECSVKSGTHKPAEAVHQIQEPENIREGAPYENPAFEQLARDLGVWGTAQSAVCAQFWLASTQAADANQLDMDRVLSIADAHADESREDGMRLIDRNGLVAFASDVLRAATPAERRREK